MDYTNHQIIVIAYVASNLLALFLLWCSWKKPSLGRLLYFFLFTWAAWTNGKLSLSMPEVYLQYADLTFIPLYKHFILGFFSRHSRPIVFSIAICQFLIAISMLLKGWIFTIGAVGAIIFLICISPLGVGAAIPATLIMATGLFMLMRKNIRTYLWQRTQERPSENVM